MLAKLLGVAAIAAVALVSFLGLERWNASHVAAKKVAVESSWGLPQVTIDEASWNEMRWGSRTFGDEWSVTMLPDLSGLASRPTAGLRSSDTPAIEYLYRPPNVAEWTYIGYSDAASSVVATANANAYAMPGLMWWRFAVVGIAVGTVYLVALVLAAVGHFDKDDDREPEDTEPEDEHHESPAEAELTEEAEEVFSEVSAIDELMGDAIKERDSDAEPVDPEPTEKDEEKAKEASEIVAAIAKRTIPDDEKTKKG